MQRTNLTPLIFFNAAQKPVNAFNRWVKKLPSKTKADHIGYACINSTEFEDIRSLFEQESAFIYQSLISQRRIAIIKLLRPLKTSCGEIWYLELADQKPDGSQVSGFDHIEMYPSKGTMESLLKAYKDKGIAFDKVERPHHVTYDMLLTEKFKIRLEVEPLVKKIMMTEMVQNSPYAK